MNKVYTLLVLIILTGICCGESEFRKWVNLDGQVIEAKLISVNGDQVVLRMKTGKLFNYALTKLSEEDHVFIKTCQKEEKQTDLPKLKQGRASKFKYTYEHSNDVNLKEKDRRYEFDVLYYSPTEINEMTSVICLLSWQEAKKRFELWEDIVKDGNYVIIAPKLESINVKQREFSDSYLTGNTRPEDYPGGRIAKKFQLSNMMDEIFEIVTASLQLQKEQYYLYADQATASLVQGLLSVYNSDKIGVVSLSNGASFLYPDLLVKSKFNNSSNTKPCFGSLFNIPTRYIVGEKLDRNDKYTPRVPLYLEKVVGDSALERNRHYFSHYREYAKTNGLSFNWEFVEVPDVGYSWNSVAKEAFGYFNTTKIK